MFIVYKLLEIYELILIARIIMSWIKPNPSNPIVMWINRITDPVLEPVRKMLPLSGAGIDFSPIIVFILIKIIKGFLIGGVHTGF